MSNNSMKTRAVLTSPYIKLARTLAVPKQMTLPTPFAITNPHLRRRLK